MFANAISTLNIPKERLHCKVWLYICTIIYWVEQLFHEQTALAVTICCKRLHLTIHLVFFTVVNVIYMYTEYCSNNYDCWIHEHKYNCGTCLTFHFELSSYVSLSYHV